MNATPTLYCPELNVNQVRFYIYSIVFTLGNLALPFLFHQFAIAGTSGGKIFLPIYFFVLVGSYAYGWKVGVATAVLSPLANHYITHMPPAPALPIIIIKGILLAIAAGIISHKTKKVSLLYIAGAILAAQVIGGIIEFFMTQSLTQATADILVSWPGLLLQLFGGYLVILLLNKHEQSTT